MKTLLRSLITSTSLLILVFSLTSCDGLVEQPTFESEALTETFTSEDFKVEIRKYECSINSFSLLVTSKEQTPIDYLNQDMFEISWKGEDRVELSTSIWLDCVSSGKYTVKVLNLKTGESSTAEAELYDVY